VQHQIPVVVPYVDERFAVVPVVDVPLRLQHCGLCHALSAAGLEEGLDLVHRPQLALVLVDDDVTDTVYVV